MMTYWASVTNGIEYEVLKGLFDWRINIWPWPILKVKVMNTSTTNILQIMTDWSNGAIAIKYEILMLFLLCVFYFGPF